MRAGCFTLFATHLGRLSELGVLYPNVRVKHFDVDTSSGKLHCTWRLKDDSADDVHYGLLLAASVGIPGEASIFRSLGCLRLGFRVQHCTWRPNDDSASDVHYGLLLAAPVGIRDEANDFPAF